MVQWGDLPTFFQISAIRGFPFAADLTPHLKPNSQFHLRGGVGSKIPFLYRNLTPHPEFQLLTTHRPWNSELGIRTGSQRPQRVTPKPQNGLILGQSGTKSGVNIDPHCAKQFKMGQTLSKLAHRLQDGCPVGSNSLNLA